MQEERFKELEHTADIAILVRGETLAELFANAAYGMACQLTDVEGVPTSMEREIALHADDVEMLLVDWLSELLFLGEKENAVFHDFEMQHVGVKELRAVARGGRIKEHQAHIKAVTFSQMDLRQTGGVYETPIVFDV